MEVKPQIDIVHLNHQVKGILNSAGVMYEGTRIQEGTLVTDTPIAAAMRLVESGVLLEVYVEQLRDTGLEV